MKKKKDEGNVNGPSVTNHLKDSNTATDNTQPSVQEPSMQEPSMQEQTSNKSDSKADMKGREAASSAEKKSDEIPKELNQPPTSVKDAASEEIIPEYPAKNNEGQPTDKSEKAGSEGVTNPAEPTSEHKADDPNILTSSEHESVTKPTTDITIQEEEETNSTLQLHINAETSMDIGTPNS